MKHIVLFLFNFLILISCLGRRPTIVRNLLVIIGTVVYHGVHFQIHQQAIQSSLLTIQVNLRMTELGNTRILRRKIMLVAKLWNLQLSLMTHLVLLPVLTNLIDVDLVVLIIIQL